ncbi:hypothetical protein DIPPA_28070 [Diplonema papillatum]|nr:hypothetical protein DIPPA_28070 [Diplonema papillatum]
MAGKARPAITGLLLALSCAAAGAGDVGCGDLVQGNSVCADMQCPRTVVAGDGTAFCVRGRPLGDPCLVQSDCQQSTCVDASGADAECTSQSLNCSCAPPVEQFRHPVRSVVTAVAAAFFFGCMFAPLHGRADPANVDVATQFLVCSGAWLVGMCFALARATATVHPFAVLGGLAFSAANAGSPLLMHLVGPASAMALWASGSLAGGWGVSFFEVLGVPGGTDGLRPALSAAGAAVVTASIAVYHRAEATPQTWDDVPPPAPPGKSAEDLVRKATDASLSRSASHATLGSSHGPLSKSLYQARSQKDAAAALFAAEPNPLQGRHWPNAGPAGPSLSPRTWSQRTRRLVGGPLAVACGVVHGTFVTPALYMARNWDRLSEDNVLNYSPYGLDYVFSTTSGVLLGALAHLLIAIAGGWAHEARPSIPSVMVFPALLSGALWGGGLALVL